MKQLQQQLTKLFTAPVQKQSIDPDYRKFRSECKRQGLTYKIAGDGFIELSNGRNFPHYNWGESLATLNNPEVDWI